MIVKNESHIIHNTLKNICEKIQISYWVISDTGSTDNTKKIIKHFFKKRKIAGELVEHEWKDFAHNRTKALECAFNKTDYILVFDADDKIEGTINLPHLTIDKYLLKFYNYQRPLLFTNRKKWFFTGVLHEYLDSDEIRTETVMEGKYHIISGRTGNRSKNPNKYLDDANTLKNAYEIEIREYLKSRYAFYCAQSFRDVINDAKIDDAIEWYEKCLQLNGWVQEKYCACIELGELYEKKNDMKYIYYWSKSCEYDSERIEGIVKLAKAFQEDDNHVMVNTIYHKWKNYKICSNKLFIEQKLYNYELEYLNSISAYYVKDYDSGLECCKTILSHRPDKRDSTIKNIQFYINAQLALSIG
jgi:hypothetical protein